MAYNSHNKSVWLNVVNDYSYYQFVAFIYRSNWESHYLITLYSLIVLPIEYFTYI